VCPVISLALFLKEILTRSGCFKPSLIKLYGMPSTPKDIQQVYQLNWGVFCALIRSDTVAILACLGLDNTWVLTEYLQDRAGISPPQGTYLIVTNAPVDERIGHWNMIKTQYKEVEYVAVEITKLVSMSYDSICSMCCLRGIFCYCKPSQLS
jgi:hypothetical protein